MAKIVKRAYKYRFYPLPDQIRELSRTFGCVRKVYNLALEARTVAWQQRQERISYVQTSALLTQWKLQQDLSYLGDVSSVPLQQALRHLDCAFVAFWRKRTHYPRFKSRKKSRASAEYTRSAFRWRDGRLWLAKMDAPLDIRWSRPLPEGTEPSTVTVSRDSAGRWFVSLLCECQTMPLPRRGDVVGIDAGITWLVTLSKGSANRDRARAKVAKIHARIADRRKDYLHKLTTRLVRENQAVVINRWCPTSKTCSACGQIARAMPLSVRAWVCESCGTSHDRDRKASRRLLESPVFRRVDDVNRKLSLLRPPQRQSTRPGGRAGSG